MTASPAPPPGRRSSEERLEILSELANEYAYTATLNASGELVLDWVTPNCERIFRASAGLRLSGDQIKGFVPAADHAKLDEWVQRLLSGHAEPVEHRFVDPRGDVSWVYHFARVTPIKGSFRIDGAALDISEHKQAELAIQRSEQRFRTIADEASDLLIEVNANARIIYVNPALEDILGWTPELVIGALLFSDESRGFIHREDAPQARKVILEGTERAGMSTQGRCRVRHSNGSWRWLEFSTRAYETTDGVHQIFVGRDITEQLAHAEAGRAYHQALQEKVELRSAQLRAATDQLRQLHSRYVMAEKLGEADELATNLARAINGPLSALLGRLQMELEAQEPSPSGLRRILLLAERIQAVVASTLTLFREGRLQLAATSAHDLVAALRDHLSDASAAHRIVLDLHVDPDLPPLWVDRPLLVSALAAIAENGVQASHEGDKLRIEVIYRRASRVIEFQIADRGSGIGPEHLPRVFEPFYTTKPTGTGLGLTIANGVVRGHRGRIEIHTRAGRGTRVEIRIPYVSPPDPAS